MEKRPYVNLGCGRRYHPEWVNIDFHPHSPAVTKHDLRKGIPLPDRSCEVVYHSAVIEHFNRPDALSFMRECFRVLKPVGIIRVGTPDIELMCRLYLKKLEACAGGNKYAEGDYDWIMLEMYDQFVREKSGGGVIEFLRDRLDDKLDFVLGRIGEEGHQIVRALRKEHAADDGAGSEELQPTLRERFWCWRMSQRKRLAALLLGPDSMRALEVGRFRMSGEVHKWAYDGHSLSRLLLQTGFVDPVRQEAGASRIPDWTRFNLDTLEDGTPVKPDLFYMEAVRPG